MAQSVKGVTLDFNSGLWVQAPRQVLRGQPPWDIFPDFCVHSLSKYKEMKWNETDNERKGKGMNELKIMCLLREGREQNQLLRVLHWTRHYILWVPSVQLYSHCTALQSSCVIVAYFLLLWQLWFREVDDSTMIPYLTGSWGALPVSPWSFRIHSLVPQQHWDEDTDPRTDQLRMSKIMMSEHQFRVCLRTQVTPSIWPHIFDH